MNRLFNLPAAFTGASSNSSNKPSRPPPPRTLQQNRPTGSASSKPTTQRSISLPSDDMVVIEDTMPNTEANTAADTGQSTAAGPSITDEEFDSISFSSSYCGEWERLFALPHFRHNLYKYGMTGKLRSSRFRSVCWKVYLGVLSDQLEEWVEQSREARDKYTELRNKLIINPRKAMDNKPLAVNNPLSQEDESPWNQYFQDNELRVTIKQDVIRTYPRIEFFHTDMVRSLMVDILFIYAKLNPEVAYRQGMHELLAPLIFVLHCDHQAFLHACEIESVGKIVREVLDPEYIEHDAYALFCQIMATVEPWYVSKETSPPCRPRDIRSAMPFARPQDTNPSNVIIAKLTRVQDYLMKKYDPELQQHLERMEIPPQIYGIRWVRLLFGREFPMQDLLVLWDAIFADSIAFDLVDYVFLAMMLYLRDALLTSDYPTCLSFLMKYPPVRDIHYFIDKALYLREPNQHPCPPTYTYQKPANYVTGGYGNGFGGNGFPSEVNKSRLMAQQRERADVWKSWLPASRRKGSTASMSQIEDSIAPHPSVLRPTSSTANLSEPVVKPSSAHYPASPALSASEYHQRKKKNNKHSKQSKISRDTAILMGRLTDMENMCQRCADKMDIHIDKLQNDVTAADTEGENELLMALAGLKQVRDVLKGILKPGAILDREEINIQDNHYSLSPRQPVLSDPRDPASPPHHDHDDEGGAKFYPGSPSEPSVCSDDLTSPEYDPAFDFSHQGQGQVDPGATFDGHNVAYGAGGDKGGILKRAMKTPDGGSTPEPKPDIELKDFNSKAKRVQNPSGELT